MNIKKFFLITMACLIIGLISFNYFTEKTTLPLVAIANYGPHASLNAAIAGIKAALQKEGFIENQTVRYEILDVGFNATLIPQMITTLKGHQPKVMIVMTTPVAQFAKQAIKDTPLIYTAITDPIAAGLITEKDKPAHNITGSADQQDLHMTLNFIKKILPAAKRIGLLYATAESNDVALVNRMQQAAQTLQMDVLAIPIDQTRDIPMALQRFNGKVDLIYVGMSGPIQPALPIIAAHSNQMRIPVFNVNEEAVKDNLVLASFGVNYYQTGIQAGNLTAAVLNGHSIATLAPLYPTQADHHAFINKKKAQALGLTFPPKLNNLVVVE